MGEESGRFDRIGVVIGAVLSLTLALFGTGFAAWVGLGAFLALLTRRPTHQLCATLAERWRTFSEDAPRAANIVTHLAALVVFALSVGALFGTPFVDAPAQGDHPAHLANAWHTRTALFERFDLFSWTHEAFAGYPTNHLYPVGSDLWVIGWHTLGLGLLDFSTAYNLSLFALLVLNSWVAFALGRRLFGPWAGLAAGLLVLCDPGAGRAGGWQWAIHQGVWPNTLAMTFTLLSLERAVAFFEGPSGKRAAGIALATTAALVTHPLMLVFYATIVVAVVFALIWSRGTELRARGLGIFAALALGGVGALFWWVPFFSTRQTARESLGTWWEPAFTLGEKMVDGSVVPGITPVLVTLALVGIFLGLRRNDFGVRLAVVTTVAPFLLFNASLLDAAHLNEIVGGIRSIQFLRMSIFVRPLVLLFAAFALVEGARHVVSGLRAAGGQRWPQLTATFAALVLAAPLLFGAIWSAFVPESLPSMQRAESWGDPSDRRALVEGLEKLPRDDFYRIGFLWDRGRNRPLLLAPEIEQPWTKMASGQPAAIFEHRIVSKHPEALRWMNVRYVVHDRDIGSPRYELVERFGALRLYRFRDAPTEPFTIDGAGEAELLEFGPERIVVEGSSDASGELILHVSNFPRWRAIHGGDELEIRSHRVRGVPDSGFMAVPFRPGETRFVFAFAWFEWLASVLSLLAFFGMLLLATRRGEAAVARQVEGKIERIAQLSVPFYAVAIGGALVVTFAMTRREPPLEEEMEVAQSFITVDGAVATSNGRACPRIDSRRVCDAAAWTHVAVTPERLEPKSQRRCVNATPDGTLEVRYPVHDLGERLVGHYGINYPSQGRQTFTFEILLDGARLHRRDVTRAHRTYRFDLPTAGKEGEELVFRVRGRGNSDRRFCFAAQTLRPPEP